MTTQQDAVIVVTPYSTGCCIALDVQQRGYKLICLWSAGFSDEMKTHVPTSCQGKLHYNVELQEQESLEATAQVVRDMEVQQGYRVVSVICGGEAGVDLADALSEYLGLKATNGTQVENRRDKKVQQELIREAGLRSVRQACGSSLKHVQAFLGTESYPLIVKPLDSAGSDGVKLCRSYDEAKTHFEYLVHEHECVNGGRCEQALCQEYLQGREYVIDQVSYDGEHKTVMLWVYDKRPANGAEFVYFGYLPIDSESAEAKLLIPYARGVCDSLGIRYGPSHCEVILTKDGPCLVEMNCRAHGGDAAWQPLCQALLGGYDQITASVDAYLEPNKFAALPDKPPSPFFGHGQCVDMVSFSKGTVASTPGYDLIKMLPSFVSLQTNIQQGSRVSHTVDIATRIGDVILMHSSPHILQRDISIIRTLERENLVFTYAAEDNKQDEEAEVEEEWSHRRRLLLLKPCSMDLKKVELNKAPAHRPAALPTAV